MTQVLERVQGFRLALGADDADADEYILTADENADSGTDAGKIKAKKKKKATADERLDIDTRLGTDTGVIPPADLV
jgi:hypothetical protein